MPFFCVLEISNTFPYTREWRIWPRKYFSIQLYCAWYGMQYIFFVTEQSRDLNKTNKIICVFMPHAELSEIGNRIGMVIWGYSEKYVFAHRPCKNDNHQSDNFSLQHLFLLCRFLLPVSHHWKHGGHKKRHPDTPSPAFQVPNYKLIHRWAQYR